MNRSPRLSAEVPGGDTDSSYLGFRISLGDTLRRRWQRHDDPPDSEKPATVGHRLEARFLPPRGEYVQEGIYND